MDKFKMQGYDVSLSANEYPRLSGKVRRYPAGTWSAWLFAAGHTLSATRVCGMEHRCVLELLQFDTVERSGMLLYWDARGVVTEDIFHGADMSHRLS